MQEVNQFFAGERGFADEPKGECLGGTKALERPTFVGAFNHLDFEAFLEHLKTVHWLLPQEVQVFYRPDDEGPSEYRTCFPVR